MKILFSGYHNPNFVTITEYMEKAIERLGHSLISFEDRVFMIPGRLRKKMRLLQNWDLKRLNNNFLSLASHNSPDLCLVTGGHRILPETIEKIKGMGIKTALWTIDPPIDFKPIIKVATSYDLIFCGGTEAQELLAKAGIKNTHWLPFACDPEFHKPAAVTLEEEKKWGSDITFVGSFYPNRHQIFEDINDFNIKIWGPGWDKLPHGSSLKHSAIDIQLKPEEWTKILCSSKIILVIHFQDGKTPCYQASPKVYETLACKSFLLVDAQRDITSLFEDGKHLAVFKDTSDLREKIDYYLNQTEKREQIALQGYEAAVQNHTFVHRIEKLIQTINFQKT